MNRPAVLVFVVVGLGLVAAGAIWYLRVDDEGFGGEIAADGERWAALGLVAMGAFFLLLMAGQAIYVRSRAERAATGDPGMARVLGVEDTGVLINDRPRLALDLEITPASGGAPLRVRTKRVIGFASLGSMQPGAVFPVSFDPARPEKFEFISHEDHAARTGSAVSPTDSVAGAVPPGGALSSLPPEVREALRGIVDPAALDDATIVQDGRVIQQGSPTVTGSIGGGAAATDPVGALERLAALHRSGALTDAEFAAAKARLLGG